MVSSANSKVQSEAPEDGERTDYDASNPSAIKDKAKAAKNRDDDVRNGLRYLMADRNGRAWMWSFLGDSGVYATSFHTSNSVMAFNEGKRQRGLEVLGAIMRDCPSAYLKMQAEQQPTTEITND